MLNPFFFFFGKKEKKTTTTWCSERHGTQKRGVRGKGSVFFFFFANYLNFHISFAFKH